MLLNQFVLFFLLFDRDILDVPSFLIEGQVTCMYHALPYLFIFSADKANNKIQFRAFCVYHLFSMPPNILIPTTKQRADIIICVSCIR